MFNHTHFSTALAAAALCAALLPTVAIAQQKDAPQKTRGIIVDEIMMLATPAKGVEPLACCPYKSNRSEDLAPGKSCQVTWKEGKTFGRDTLRLVRLEIVKGGATVAQFTVTLKPQQEPMVMQCMKGFGCTGTWEAFPWKSPKGNYLEHTTHKFRLTPNNATYFTVQNLDDKTPITVKVNPCE